MQHAGRAGSDHRGIAAIALGVIVVVTVAWWALALYPAGTQAPEWLVRTRMACFGALPGGLPNAGGWVLLVGEPIGMLAALGVVWGGDVAGDLRSMAARWWGRGLLGVASGGLLWGAYASARIVRGALPQDGAERFATAEAAGGAVAVSNVPPLALVDQRGDAFDLARIPGPVLVTFAYAHCETVCPTIVRRVLDGRDDARRPDIPLVIVTVDPWRDVPSRLPAIADGWELASGDRVLSGDVSRVNGALDAWGVGRARDDTSGEVSHAVVVVLVDRDHRSSVRLTGSMLQLADLLRGA